MSTALGGAACRRAALSEQFISRVLGQLTLAAAAAAAATASKIAPSGPCPCQGGRLRRPETRRSSSSSSQWRARQSGDQYTAQAKLQGLKSRAAFKLMEINKRYGLFRRNQTVVDLGYAPGSWSQVARDATAPHGVVVGIDIIPAQPPRGVTTIQGNFLQPRVRALVKDVLVQQVRGKERSRRQRADALEGEDAAAEETAHEGISVDQPSYVELEKQAMHDRGGEAAKGEEEAQSMVDVVISDMLMNTSGIDFADHAVSMDLCYTALIFASETLKPGGHFVCKFYQGREDKILQKRLEMVFERVHRDKPKSSRKDSKEAYFVALGRRQGVAFTSGEVDQAP